ncbi:MAG: helix-turn-helix domain-containing protein [Chloroflexota bacterium]
MRDDVIGRGLRALRHRRGLRQRDLSGIAGVARSVIADFEAGRLGPHSVDALRRVADAGGG